MFKKFLVVLCMSFACVFAGCSSPVSDGNLTVYTMDVEGQSAPYTLNLDESKQTFQFVYSFSRYLPYGKYTIEDNTLKFSYF